MRYFLLVNTGNDADIIKESLTHNEKFFDRIHVLDNGSKDNTVAEIVSLNNPKISIMRADNFPPYALPVMQQQIISSINQYEIFRNVDDYFIILDADEFIVAENLEELHAIPKSKVGAIPWKCYVPENNVYSDVKKNITKRRTIEPEGCHKVVIPRYTKFNNLLLGGHYVHDHEGTRIPHIMLKTISIAHFPVRYIEQYNKKIDFFRSADLSWLNKEQLIHLINTPKIQTVEELIEIATNYCGSIKQQTLIYDPVL